MKESDEFLILQKYFKNLGSQFNDSSGIIIGPGDDAGQFSNKNTDLVFSTDVSNSNVHFPKTLAPDLIAYRACCVAASDIPACGAILKWLSISLVTPSTKTEWIKKFSQGIRQFTKDYQVPIIGGDLAKGKECSVSVGVCGEVDRRQFLSRNGAEEGDSIFLSGTLGLAKLGLDVLTSKKKKPSNSERKYLKKFLKPEVQCLLGTNLRGIANSCIDISDGLIGDLGHICKQSKVGAQINIDLIPYEGEYEEALTWGDDYELCFTVPTKKEKQLRNISNKLNSKIFKIGKIIKGKNLEIYKGGERIFIKNKSYNHFKS